MTVTLVISDERGTVDLSNNYRNYYPENLPYDESIVTERASFRFTGGIDTIRTTINSLNRYFQSARDFQDNRTGYPVYAKMKYQASDDLYRSEILDGRVIAHPRLLGAGLAGGTIAADHLLFEIEWTRKNYWEHDTMQYLPCDAFGRISGGLMITTGVWGPATITAEAVSGGTYTSGASVTYGTLLGGTWWWGNGHIPIPNANYDFVVHYTKNGTDYSSTLSWLPAGSFWAYNGSYSNGIGTFAPGNGLSSGYLYMLAGGAVFSLTWEGGTAGSSGTITADYVLGGDNRLTIAGSLIAGDLPAPVQIRMGDRSKNNNWLFGATYGEAAGADLFTQGSEYWDSWSSYAALGTLIGGPWDGGSVKQWPSGSVNTGYLTLGGSIYGNEYYVPLVRMSGETPAGSQAQYDLWWRFPNQQAGSFNPQPVYDYQGSLTYPGLVRLPPITFYSNAFRYEDGYVGPGTPYTSPNIQTSPSSSAPAGGTVNYDYIDFMPTKAGYCEVHASQYGATGYRLVIDGPNERVYADSGFTKTYDFALEYGWIYVYPGEDWMLKVYEGDGWGMYETIEVWYRPRKALL